MEKLILTSLLMILILSFIIRFIIFKINKIKSKGLSSVHPFMFRIGKMTMFATWMLLIVKLYIFDISIVPANIWVMRIAVLLFAAGVILNIASSLTLGFSFRAGLPKENTSLKVNGVYRISRNPMLLSLYFITIGACIYIMNPLVWIPCIISIVIHHKIIIAEEKFLEVRFGEEWVDYKNRVRRYL